MSPSTNESAAFPRGAHLVIYSLPVWIGMNRRVKRQILIALLVFAGIVFAFYLIAQFSG